MRYPTTVRETIHRPIVLLHVESPPGGRHINVDALVDTGADVSLLPSSMAAQLGIELSAAPQMPIGSPIGTSTTYRMSEVILELRRGPDIVRWRTNVGFIDRRMPYAILGTRGFFEFFRLTYDANQHSFDLDPAATMPQ